MPRGLAALLLLLVILSCTSGTRFEGYPTMPLAPVELKPAEIAEAQRRSLRYLFYHHNEAPPTPSPAELRRLDRDLAGAPPVEVRELQELFGNDFELLAFATRDTDGDGVLDYRISEYRGKFFEGDIDIDGDGIRNVYDSAPYDRRVGGVDTNGDGTPDEPGSFDDRDGDGIPDHLDWSRRKPEPLPGIQTGLFRDFGVILVERSARFSPALVHAVDDTLRLVFRQPLATLRTIAVEDQLLISPDLGDNGFMLGQTQTLTVYTKSLEQASPIALLGLMIHEVDHAWQLAQDFDGSALAAENVKMHFPPGRFTRSLERFGWEVDHRTMAEGYRHRLYWPHFYATSPRYFYRGSSPHEWATWFEDVQRESGPDFLRNSPAVTWGMVGPYSLTSPWEWHADHLMAAFYNRLDRGINQHDNRTYRNIAALLRAAMLESVQDQWSRFDYRNATGSSIDRALRRRFALTKAEVEMLVERYVIPLADFPMLSHALALESASTDSFSASVGAAWDDLRKQVHEPLRRRPNLHGMVKAVLSPWHDERRVSDSGSAGAGDLPGPRVGVHAEPAGLLDELDEFDDQDQEALADPDAGLFEGLLPREGFSDGVGPKGPRTGLPNDRGGAGRVGGVANGYSDEFAPIDEVPPQTGDAEPQDAAEAADDPREGLDAVIHMFEELRGGSKPAEPKPAEPEPEPGQAKPKEADPDGADSPADDDQAPVSATPPPA